uniref:Uncharacterized protein n=1 Tax=uncultured Caudovirales phage TaxID=2100421 RepID=A0A6J5L4K9_9CAUD|nr:hypothetical protein UFOVP114_17 [uncultured Caudovirales phage]
MSTLLDFSTLLGCEKLKTAMKLCAVGALPLAVRSNIGSVGVDLLVRGLPLVLSADTVPPSATNGGRPYVKAPMPAGATYDDALDALRTFAQQAQGGVLYLPDFASWPDGVVDDWMAGHAENLGACAVVFRVLRGDAAAWERARGLCVLALDHVVGPDASLEPGPNSVQVRAEIAAAARLWLDCPQVAEVSDNEGLAACALAALRGRRGPTSADWHAAGQFTC